MVSLIFASFSGSIFTSSESDNTLETHDCYFAENAKTGKGFIDSLLASGQVKEDWPDIDREKQRRKDKKAF